MRRKLKLPDKFALIAAAALALWLFSGDVSAQCVMCKAVAEAGAKSGGVGSGINTGILYIMAIPYVLLGTLAFVIFRNQKKPS